MVARRARAGPLLPRRRARHARRVPAPARRRRLPRRRRTSCARVLDWCGERDVAVVPVGGGTSVVGGIDARPGPGHAGVVAVNLRALDRVLEVDPVSRAARIQAGATGPRLEEQLAEHGLTLRFYPQSFELATLGGWIVTRAGGHFASGPTHIDDLVESVRALTVGRRRVGVAAAAGLGRRARRPTGCCSARRARSRSITEAWVRVLRAARAAALGDASGSPPSRPAAPRCARSSRRGCGRPTAASLDAEEARADDGGRRRRAHLLVLGFEEVVEPADRASRSAAPRRRGVEERAAARARGARRSCARPTCATRSSPWGCSSETFETAITWERLPAFVETVKGAVREALGPEGSVTLPAHARLSRRRGALLHRARAGRARRRGRALGRDQGRRGGRRARRRRHDHPPPRGRPRPPPVVRPPAPGAVRGRAARPPRRRSIHADCSTPGYSSTRDEQRQREEHGGGLQGQGGPRQDLPLGRHGDRGPHGLLRHRAHGLG